MDDRPPPDGCEKSLRFGCGTITGGVIVLFIFGRYFFSLERWLWIAVGLGALVCGLLAIRYGDDFYHGIIEFFRNS